MLFRMNELSVKKNKTNKTMAHMADQSECACEGPGQALSEKNKMWRTGGRSASKFAWMANRWKQGRHCRGAKQMIAGHWLDACIANTQQSIITSSHHQPCSSSCLDSHCTVDGDVAADVRLNVLHRLHLLAESPAGGLEGHQLIVLAGETRQVILQLLHTGQKEREKDSEGH